MILVEFTWLKNPSDELDNFLDALQRHGLKAGIIGSLGRGFNKGVLMWYEPSSSTDSLRYSYSTDVIVVENWPTR